MAAVHSPAFQDIVTLGQTEWLAGKHAAGKGPKLLHDLLVTVSEHRAEAAQRGIIISGPPDVPPQGEVGARAAEAAWGLTQTAHSLTRQRRSA